MVKSVGPGVKVTRFKSRPYFSDLLLASDFMSLSLCFLICVMKVKSITGGDRQEAGPEAVFSVPPLFRV